MKDKWTIVRVALAAWLIVSTANMMFPPLRAPSVESYSRPENLIERVLSAVPYPGWSVNDDMIRVGAAGLVSLPPNTSQSTASASATCGDGNEGSYVEAYASTSTKTLGLAVQLRTASGTAVTYLIDVATGAGGSESVVINDLQYVPTSLVGVTSTYYSIPVFDIPASTRIAWRCRNQSTGSTPTIGAVITLFGRI